MLPVGKHGIGIEKLRERVVHLPPKERGTRGIGRQKGTGPGGLLASAMANAVSHVVVIGYLFNLHAEWS